MRELRVKSLELVLICPDCNEEFEIHSDEDGLLSTLIDGISRDFGGNNPIWHDDCKINFTVLEGGKI